MKHKTHDLVDKTYYYHINGMKGFACLLIMIGHYLGLYKYAQSFIPSIHIIDAINNSSFSFIIDESYWLYLFFVVSGYLVAKSQIANIKDFFCKSINRFLRLALPILFSCLIIYLIYVIVGFHTIETNKIFISQWYQNFYTDVYTIKDVLLSPFLVLLLGKNTLNGPYWVLRMMFLSSLIIYLLKLIFTKFNNSKYESFIFSLLIIFTIVTCFISHIITACLVGMIVSFYEKSEIKTKSCYAFWFLFVTMSLYVISKPLMSIFFFASLIVFIPKIKMFNVIFSSKSFQFLGKLSWGIYSFHWPIICSFGALSIIQLAKHIGLVQSYFVSFTFVLILTFIFSICFYYTFEKFAKFLTKKVDELLLQLIIFLKQKKLIDILKKVGKLD